MRCTIQSWRCFLVPLFIASAISTADGATLTDLQASTADAPLFPASTGLYGQTITGTCIATHYGITNLSNASNFTPPYATVGVGAEFSADFDDIFGQHWHETVDFHDNYTVFFHHSSPNPSANIGSSQLVQWHLTGFDFPIVDFQLIVAPSFMPRYIASFDANNIWVGFDALAAYSPYNEYGFQIVIPEPSAALTLLILTATLSLSRPHRIAEHSHS